MSQVLFPAPVNGPGLPAGMSVGDGDIDDAAYIQMTR
jgi:hypothetical protein